jgi:aldehyde dehydrogenase (NAD+)
MSLDPNPLPYVRATDQPCHPSSFIDNEFVKGVDGKTFEVINPSTEEVICSVHEATEKDVDIAVAAARKAFEGQWRKETPEKRGKLLNNLAQLFEKNIDLLASVESLDNGKAVSMAKVDIGMAAGCLRYYGGWADKIEGKVVDTSPDTFNYIKKEPIGVCGQIIPWNFPLLMWRHVPCSFYPAVFHVHPLLVLYSLPCTCIPHR